MLDDLGIDYVEGGYPGANPTDTQLFAENRNLDATFTAFGMTRRPGRSTSNDPGLAALLEAKADAICFVAKSWDYHVRVALETTPEENLASIRDSVGAAVAKGREVLLDCEHFFDGYKANPQFALACAKAAMTQGARWIVLCDTNGGALPHEVETVVGEVIKLIPGDHVGIHAHNDTEQAVANSLAAGARRCAPDSGHAQRPRRALRQRQSRVHHPHAQAQAGIRRPLRDRRVGRAAQEPGACVAYARRDAQPRAQPPRALCRRERVRDQGRHPRLRHHEGSRDLRARPARSRGQPTQASGVGSGWKIQRPGELERIGLKIDKDDTRIMQLLDVVKEREAIGYAYEAADASFELLARRVLGKVPNYFDVEKFDVNVEQRDNAVGQRVTVSLAVVKVKVDGETLISAAEGNGPVNALDLALRKDLGKYQGYINGLELTDYRVRILNGGTEAVTRVLIESRDESGERWTTVGVSPNIIDASFRR
jgi:2-isopropylmalate synthase